MTIPRYIARHWKLEPGVRLVVRSTDRGILLYPRYFIPYVERDASAAASRSAGGAASHP
jgi:hypothetical protein